jgi:hypothetical protein
VLFRNEDWNRLKSRNATVVFLSANAEIDCSIKFPLEMLADIFALTSSRVRITCVKAKTECPPYHPLSLTDEKEETGFKMVRGAALTGHYVIQKEMLHFIETEFRRAFASGWMDSFCDTIPGHSESDPCSVGTSRITYPEATS